MKQLVKEYYWLLLIGIAVFALALVVLFVSYGEPGRIIAAGEIVLIGTLVIATLFYAKKTADIETQTKKQAEAAEEQAQATQALAKQTVRQMHQALLPVIKFDSLQLWPHGYSISVKNIGQGPALNLRCWVIVTNPVETLVFNRGLEHSVFQTTAIGAGEGHGIDIRKIEGSEYELPFWTLSDSELSGATEVTYKAIYQDVYSYHFASEVRVRRNPQNNSDFVAENLIVREMTKEEAEKMLREGGYLDKDENK